MIDEKKINIIRKSKPFALADIIVIAAAVVLIVVLMIAVYGKKGASLEIITPDGVRSYSLNKDRIIELDHLKVVVSGGKVWVEDADCPDKVCERTGNISRANQSIACLPNGIIIRIKSGGGIVETG